MRWQSHAHAISSAQIKICLGRRGLHLFGVHAHHMSVQIVLAIETLATIGPGADVRPLAAVRFHVPAEMVAIIETLLAAPNVADVRLRDRGRERRQS